MNLTVFYILAGVISIGLGFFFYKDKIFKKKRLSEEEIKAIKTDEVKPKSDPTFSRIYDNLRRAIYNETLPGETIDEIKSKYGNLGRRWNRDGNELYTFVKTVDEEYIPVSRYMKITRDNPPSLLHGALIQPQTAIAFNVKIQRNFMQKWGPILLFAGVGIFCMVLLIAN